MGRCTHPSSWMACWSAVAWWQNKARSNTDADRKKQSAISGYGFRRRKALVTSAWAEASRSLGSVGKTKRQGCWVPASGFHAQPKKRKGRSEQRYGSRARLTHGVGSLQVLRAVTGRRREGEERKRKKKSKHQHQKLGIEWKAVNKKRRENRQNKRDLDTRRRTEDQLQWCPAVPAEVDRCKGDKDKKGCNRTPCTRKRLSPAQTNTHYSPRYLQALGKEEVPAKLGSPSSTH